MRRSRPLRSNPATARAWRARSAPLRRTGRPRPKPLDPDVKATRAEVRQIVYTRDQVCQVAARIPAAGDCFGPLTPHHRRKASGGGGYTPENLTAVCAHHNDQIEADADLARAAHQAGLVVRRGDPEWDQLA